jgi:hypothetical protein
MLAGQREEQSEQDLRHTSDTGGDSTESKQRGDYGDDHERAAYFYIEVTFYPCA